jgi:hypothetical protein
MHEVMENVYREEAKCAGSGLGVGIHVAHPGGEEAGGGGGEEADTEYQGDLLNSGRHVRPRGKAVIVRGEG